MFAYTLMTGCKIIRLEKLNTLPFDSDNDQDLGEAQVNSKYLLANGEEQDNFYLFVFGKNVFLGNRA